MTYRDGVYDVTEFAAQHPGGMPRLMLAAGGAIDPFWAMYQQHNTDQVQCVCGVCVCGGSVEAAWVQQSAVAVVGPWLESALHTQSAI